MPRSLPLALRTRRCSLLLQASACERDNQVAHEQKEEARLPRGMFKLRALAHFERLFCKLREIGSFYFAFGGKCA